MDHQVTGDPPEAELAKEILRVMVNSTTKRKVLVHFKFKYPATEHQEWLTYRQYLALRTIESLDFCKVIT